ncbi:D-alanyl-D-alanine carboxypeptidase [Candidatus Phycorickettsia trachydisci]|uniref:D-alanyl-D-alanine carboxypeptidase n=1 Tax=Candidatus Phycorickettsia trachydisci TaxID=2115978 RepID=A0A2P1P701_9RICK|nr:D-alanyl-D-alanine carboxypeptidase/D-alanyl-D-alanine-endopeptidase [Candidatus Phycorickettsia trachydisci]AVP87049.1 D-alanyl-D-alanine carboxypeptidase [Candidatus Phycorickettsia trachydisci]
MRILILFLLLTSCSPRLYNQKPAFYSYIIGYTKGNRITTEHASKVYATPASCQKVITALVALKELGPDYRYKTRLFSSNNDIVIVFSGDPTLTTNDLALLLAPLENKQIKGKIILDASVFQASPYSPHMMIDDIGKKYAPPVWSINIDHNLINFKVVPSTVFNPLIVSDAKYKIISNITSSDKASSVKSSWNQGRFYLKGNININEVHKFQVAPEQIQPFIIQKIQKLLDGLGIKGKIQISTKTFNYGKLINQIDSEPLVEILKPALKQSDNLVFDSLYLTMLRINQWQDGDSAIKKLIKKHYNLDFKDSTILDGSGLSRYNQVQPYQLFELLKRGYQVPDFIDLLPYPGEEQSTLARRLNLPADLKAKTGNMKGLSCLCGYSKSKTFVIMTNSFAPPSNDMFGVIDNFLSLRLNN